ncbi:cephalotoxin-like protein [Xiphophorus couchianus]|uniref:cephalotoxin-like protein n=1 Tax=Xiphophorus couchianus TaxID=32473 RepID=UPI001017008A|nr:cephalotoxin-like protein [Xiphophorus couchianus]
MENINQRERSGDPASYKMSGGFLLKHNLRLHNSKELLTKSPLENLTGPNPSSALSAAMAPKRSASMLLASMILLHWATFSVRSDPSTSAIGMPYESREKTEKTLNVAKESLTLFKDAMGSMDSKKLSDVMKGISSFASFAPGVGAVVFSVVNMVLAFIPQDDPVLSEVKKGFVEVNQKQDSLSIKISNLATDVEWFNYASVYSRDELTILNTFEKFGEFLHRTESQSPEETSKKTKIFTSYYESSGAESSVSNLYRYLTVDSTSLSENLNSLLKKKFKCDVYMISRYNLYLSSLFWKGMILNQFYWKLTGVKSKAAEPGQMFKKVSEAQLSAVEFCLTNYKQYLKKDVVEITKDQGSDQNALALQVKEALDNKYSWYNWVVVVFDKSQNKNIMLNAEFTFNIGNLVVAVDYTVKADMTHVEEVKNTARECLENMKCEPKTISKFFMTAQRCSHKWFPKDHDEEITIPLTKYTKVTQVAYGSQFIEVPTPFHRVKCSWSGYDSWISVHYSRLSPVCVTNQCKNNGICKRLVRSNEWFCECPDSYYGDTCEKQMIITEPDPTLTPVPNSPVESKQQVIIIVTIISVLILLFVLVLTAVLKCRNRSLCRQLNGPCLELKRGGEHQGSKDCRNP